MTRFRRRRILLLLPLASRFQETQPTCVAIGDSFVPRVSPLAKKRTPINERPVYLARLRSVFGHKRSDEKTKGLLEGTPVATLEQRHQLMNTEATVDNNFELFEAQRVEEIKVW